MAIKNLDSNNLSILNYKMKLNAIPNVEYRVQSLSIPGMTLGAVAQATPFVPIWQTGNISYNEMQATFLVGENLKDYMEIFDWMTRLGYPDSTAQYKRTVTDGSVLILNSAKHPILNVRFTDMIPTSLSDLNFDTTLQEVQYMTATVTFRFTRFYYDPVI